MPTISVAAAFGFAFAAAWAAFGLGWAALCLLLAVVFALIAALGRGQLDLDDLRERGDAARAGFAAPSRRKVG